MATHKAPKYLAIAATFCSLLVLPARAQDPPTRVADLNFVTGNVSMQPAGIDDWSPAVMNRPFTTGDNLWADTDGRAELHLNNAVLRVGPQTSVGFLNLDDRIAQIRFTQGELVMRVRRLRDDESFEVDTPSAAVTILRPGLYRFQADPDSGTTWVMAREGEAEITGGGQAFTLHTRNSAQLTGTDQLSFDVEYVPPPDWFENWCADRDTHEARLISARYLPPDVIGYEELDNYGTWRETEGYGAVWYPQIEAGWAPYSRGHWAWVEPWGWTWVDDAPWGFAPSHYGRWAFISGTWGWIPGPVAIAGGGPPSLAPVYAPALVAFIGGGGFGVSLSLGGPAVGWVPLGPGEVYAPAYQVSQNYFRTVNVSSTTVVNTVNITNVYNNVYVNKTVTNVTVNQRFANMTAPNAVTAMPQNAFASGRPVRQAGIAVPAAQVGQIRSNTMMALAPPVAPAKQAVAPMAGTGPAPRPPARAVSVPVVAKAAPPPPPVAFAAKQQALQQNVGRPVNIQAIRQSVPAAAARPAAPAPAVHVAPPARQVVPQVKPTPAAPPPPPGNRPAQQPGTPAPTFRPPAQQPNNPQQPAQTPTPGYRPPAQPPVTPQTPNYRPPAQPPVTPQMPSNRPPAENRPPANQETRPPAENRPPANQETRPPAQPVTPQQPAYRPPAEVKPPANQETRPPVQQPPAYRPPAESRPPANQEYRPPAQQPPAQQQQKPPAKQTQKPKKETDKPKQ